MRFKGLAILAGLLLVSGTLSSQTVITSYSIHYTKLYEKLESKCMRLDQDNLDLLTRIEEFTSKDNL